MSEHLEVETSVQLLERWLQNDKAALAVLVERHRPWLHQYVSKKLSNELRASAAQGSEDIVQDALLGFLKLQLRYVPESDNQLRGLLARIALNRIQVLARRVNAGRPTVHHTRSVSEVIRERTSRSPSAVAAKREDQQLVELALELIGPEKRIVLEQRYVENLSYAEMAARQSIEVKTVTKRVERAMTELGRIMRKVEAGQWESLDLDLNAISPNF